MTEAHVPAPAKHSTNPKKITASNVDKVQGVPMWITQARIIHNVEGFIKSHFSAATVNKRLVQKGLTQDEVDSSELLQPRYSPMAAFLP
jgi:hypothetical protein